MKPIILILMVSLVLSMGCAKPDWIQSTLMTVDVTGTWQRVSGGTVFQLELDQQGPKVQGTVRTIGVGSSVPVSGRIEGTVAGDVFRDKFQHSPRCDSNGHPLPTLFRKACRSWDGLRDKISSSSIGSQTVTVTGCQASRQSSRLLIIQ